MRDCVDLRMKNIQTLRGDDSFAVSEYVLSEKDEPDLRHDFSRLVQKIRQIQAVPDLTDFYITFLTFYAVYTVILHPG